MVDANVLFSGVGWEGPPSRILSRAIAGTFHCVLCDYIIEETRFRVAEKILHVSSTLEQFLRDCDYELVADASEEDVAVNLDLVRHDPYDVPVALAAIQANVTILVTGDKHLHHTDNVRLQSNLTLIKPADFLTMIE